MQLREQRVLLRRWELRMARDDLGEHGDIELGHRDYTLTVLSW